MAFTKLLQPSVMYWVIFLSVNEDNYLIIHELVCQCSLTLYFMVIACHSRKCNSFQIQISNIELFQLRRIQFTSNRCEQRDWAFDWMYDKWHVFEHKNKKNEHIMFKCQVPRFALSNLTANRNQSRTVFIVCRYISLIKRLISIQITYSKLQAKRTMKLRSTKQTVNL